MVIAHGECSGLPEFGEIVQIIVLQDKPLFIVRRLDAWYTEHYRAYVLVQSSDKKIELLEHHDLRPISTCSVHNWGETHGGSEEIYTCLRLELFINSKKSAQDVVNM